MSYANDQLKDAIKSKQIYFDNLQAEKNLLLEKLELKDTAITVAHGELLDLKVALDILEKCK
jgi:hypothetical protein